DDMRVWLHRVADWVADYRETIEDRPIVPAVVPGEIAAQLPARLPDAAAPLETLFGELDRVLMPGIVHWGHPSFLGYFGSTSNGPALLAAIVAAALNVSAMTWRTSPTATELESVVLDWIREMTGLPEEMFGVVYDTASVAVVHALAAARERAVASAGGGSVRTHGVMPSGPAPLRVYASDQAHSSLDKAMIVLGLGEANVVRVASDAAFRLDVGALRAAIDADIADGHRPMAVVATVGTTSTASVDPVAAIAAVCREHDVWLHVDAAYGGALALLSEEHSVMDGVALADSVVINPHKWMFVPLDFSALYTPHRDALRRVFSLVPEYLRGDAAETTNATVDYMDYGVQLGRRFRALKAWMVFRAFGRAGVAARIREHVRLARTWATWVEHDDAFALAAPVRMAVVCFRCAPPGISNAGADRLNESIVEAVNASGDGYLTHTRLRGRVVMRVGIGNVLTTERHLAHVWSRVRAEAAARMARAPG
ncbi:MAG: aminotransferase class I/II-fold pyridoxal phosphate-dependent enzyme, partial [Gemmatimonadaceae bacterium]